MSGALTGKNRTLIIADKEKGRYNQNFPPILMKPNGGEATMSVSGRSVSPLLESTSGWNWWRKKAGAVF